MSTSTAPTVSGRAPDRLPARAATASLFVAAVNGVSRLLRRGSGTVIGGRIGLLVDPGLLRSLSAGHPVVLVSGTNGKTTTTRLLAAALSAPAGAAGSGAAVGVVTNATGSNMPAGHVAALVAGRRRPGRRAPAGAPVVLEVDEGYLPRVVAETQPLAVVLLNLSRDQLDRISEVRMLAGRWREVLGGEHGPVVVANADDPMVVWAASKAQHVVWVAAGQVWRADAVGCPACGGTIESGPAGGAGLHADWRCACGFRRPDAAARLEDDDLVLEGGRRIAVTLAMPGRFNQANAAMAAVAAGIAGTDERSAMVAMAGVGDVAGRFAVATHRGTTVQLMLAKNPAGWTALLDLLAGDGRPVVVAINAREADGKDPSWLWDVPFERLVGREVVAAGERCLDLAVRLHYAEVPHGTERDLERALTIAAGHVPGGTDRPDGQVVAIGNYTAFQQLRSVFAPAVRRR